VLQPYSNLLNSGYNGGSHTEPYYRIYSYLFMGSDLPFVNHSDLAIENVSILDAGVLGEKIVSYQVINKGSVPVKSAEIGYLINNSDATVKTTALDLNPGMSVNLEMTVANLDLTKPGILMVFADSENDQVVTNNSKAIEFGNYTSMFMNPDQRNIELFPNPARDLVTVVSHEISPVRITIFDSMGRQVYENKFSDQLQIRTKKFNGSGMLLLKFATKNHIYIKKLVVE